MTPDSPASPASAAVPGPLAGIRVVEMCNTFAGPVCGRLMADFGADVIKVEPLDGDPVRQMGSFAQGVSLQAASILRGKRSLAMDLKRPEAKAIFEDLLQRADVLIENNRPGVLERLGFDPERLRRDHPRLVIVRISGFGQDGPYAARPGYGAICDAFAGIRDLTGDPDRPPSRVALATTDYLTAVYSAFGTMLALFHRQHSGQGQVVDAALFEAAFSQMEGHVPAFEKTGYLPQRQGAALPHVAPNNQYPTRDGFVLIAANNGSTWERLAEAIGRPDLLRDPRFLTVQLRGEHAAALDAEVAQWTRERTGAEVEALLLGKEVPVSRVCTIADAFTDSHFAARRALLQVAHPLLGSMTQIGIVPRLSETPGSVTHTGPNIGQDSVAILRDELGYEARRIEALLEEGVVAAGGPSLPW